MNTQPERRKCSAVCRNGHPCQAWAVIGSDPALCAAHAGRNVGAGAPKGNKNALKHGLYVATMKPDEVEDLEMLKSTSLMHELVLMRVVLRRMMRYLDQDDLDLADVMKIAPVISTLVRTVIRLQNHIDDNGFDWDVVLDELGKEWGRQL